MWFQAKERASCFENVISIARCLEFEVIRKFQPRYVGCHVDLAAEFCRRKTRKGLLIFKLYLSEMDWQNAVWAFLFMLGLGGTLLANQIRSWSLGVSFSHDLNLILPLSVLFWERIHVLSCRLMINRGHTKIVKDDEAVWSFAASVVNG